jgi:ATP-dependent DNA ligase
MRRRRQDAAFYAFDVLWLNGEDLRGLGLLERKRILRKIIRGHDRILYAAHVERRGLKLFEAVCQKDCEGIVAKHRLAPYVGKPQTWFKILNPEYTQKRGRKEMFDKFHEREHVVAVIIPRHVA